MNTFTKNSSRLFSVVLFLSFAGIVLSIILQIFCRYVLGSALSWTEEIARLLFCWLAFVGSALASLEKSHLEVDFFFGKMPPAVQRIVDILIKVLILALSIVVLISSLKLISSQTGMKSIALRLPMAVFSVSILIGFAGILYYSILSIIKPADSSKE